VQAPGTVRSIYTRCLGWTGVAVTGVQTLAGKASAAGEDLGFRCVETGVWVGAVAYRQSAHVDAVGGPVDGVTSGHEEVSAESLLVLPVEPCHRRELP